MDGHWVDTLPTTSPQIPSLTFLFNLNKDSILYRFLLIPQVGAKMVPERLEEQKDILSVEFEKRKCKRLLMKDNVFAALRDGFQKVGKIDDISLKGIGFSYLKQTSSISARDHDYQVDIFLPQNGLHLFNIPCRTVYEKSGVSIVEGFPVKLSRCGLHFGKLSEIQLNLLDFIIAKFTVKRRLKKKVLVAQDNLFKMP